MKRLMLLLLAAVFLAGAASASEAPGGFVLHAAPKPLPELRFQGADGGELTLADFDGKVVLLNVWATWCGPCRREMPTLDRLQGELGGDGFEVVALSIDRAGPKVVQAFFAELAIEHLALYIDASAETSNALGIVGLPTTLLIDRQGRELGRLVGPTEWDTPEMIDFLTKAVARQKE